MRVVDDEQAGLLAAGRLGEDARDAVEEARLRAGPVERRRRRRPELGNETRGLGRRGGSDRAALPSRSALRTSSIAQPNASSDSSSMHRARRRDAAACAHAGDELVGEPRLADPRLAVEHDEAAFRADLRVRVEQRGELALATDERMRRASVATSGVRRWLDRGGAALADGVVDGGRLFGRGDAELAVEDADAVAVLRERSGALAARAVEARSAGGARPR